MKWLRNTGNNKCMMKIKKLLFLWLVVISAAHANAQVELKTIQQTKRDQTDGKLSDVKDSEIKLFIQDFLTVRDSAGLTPFYSRYKETKESYRFYTRILKEKHSTNWYFEETVPNINLDSFLHVTEILFYKRMRWIYVRCSDSSYEVGGLDTKADFKSIYSGGFKDGDVVEFSILFAGKERYAWFRLYYHNMKWFIRFSTTYCTG
jgi:hypothetical protein